MDRLGGDGRGDGDVERRGAGRGRGRGSWAPMPPNTQKVHMLRRPRHSGPGRQVAGSMEPRNHEQNKSDTASSDIIKNSTLSVHAAVFVPKGYSAERLPQGHPRAMGTSSIQDRIQLARETSNHLQMIQSPYYTQNYEGQQHYHQTQQPHQFENYAHQQPVSQHGNAQSYRRSDGGVAEYRNRHHQEQSGDDEMIDLANTTQQLLGVIHSLTLNPGRFSSLVPSLINSLRPYLEHPSQLRDIVGIIIQQSVNEVNFRYSGARLCTCLDTTVTPNEKATFKEVLYTLCKEETESQARGWQQRNEHGEEAQKKCHGLILFLAELVTQAEDKSAFGLGELLVQLITVVLKNPAPNSVKHICQALKLAGQTLERDKRGSRKEMENMMRALTELVTENRVDLHVGRMVHSVHELRNGNWGQGTSTGGSSSVDPTHVVEPSEGILDEPVLYGPDGQVLSAEENQFLEDVAESGTNSDDNIIADHSYGDGGRWMSEDDDELDAAYEEFLKLIPKK